jgi:hypothetical protein
VAWIARLSGKFRLLAEAATSGAARIDQVAFAVRQLDQTPAMRLFARTRAVIVHHEGHWSIEVQSEACGCFDWRTDADLDAESEGSDWHVFPTGLYRSEWSQVLQPDLDGHAEMVERHRALAAMKEAKAKAWARFAKTEPPQPTAPAITTATGSGAEPALMPDRPLTSVGPVDYGEPPFLSGASWWRPGQGREAESEGLRRGRSCPSSPSPEHRSEPFPMPDGQTFRLHTTSGAEEQRPALLRFGLCTTQAGERAGRVC